MKKLLIKKCLLILVLVLMPGILLAKDKPKAPRAKGLKVFKVDWAKSIKTSGSKKRYFPDMASPVEAGGRLFVGTHGGVFYCLDATSGKVIWKAETSGPIATQALITDTLAIVGNNKGVVSMYDIASGRLVSESYVGSEVLAQPATDGSKVYVLTTAREVFALGMPEGQAHWSSKIKGFDTKFTMRGTSKLIYSGGRLLVGMSDGQVVALSAANGQTLWAQNLATGQEAFKDIDSSLLIDGDVLFAVGYFGYLVKMSASDGHVIYKRECRSGSELASSGQLLIVATTEGHVVAFDKQSGQRQWDTPLYSGTLSSPHVQGNTVVVGANDGLVYILSLEKGEPLQTFSMNAGYMGQAALTDRAFFVLSSTAKLYRFSAL